MATDYVPPSGETIISWQKFVPALVLIMKLGLLFDIGRRTSTEPGFRYCLGGVGSYLSSVGGTSYLSRPFMVGVAGYATRIVYGVVEVESPVNDLIT